MELSPSPPLDRLEQLLRGWCAEHPVQHSRLENLLPAIVAEAARAPEPEPTLQSSLDLLAQMAQWQRYLTSLSEHPGAVRRLVSLIGASPWLGQLLAARPALADELLPDRFAARPPDRAALRASLHDTLKCCSEDEPTQWIALRNFKHSCLLHILALDLEAKLSLAEVSGALSDLADVLLETVLTRVGARQAAVQKPAFDKTPAPLGIVAYGKLGSREMSYASDTDIVFLHEDAPDTSAAGLARLASTVNQWVTAPTAAGILYETDFRLRPYGASGLLVTSLSAFRDYQLNAAWTWEHQALTRARFIAGASSLADAFARLRRDVLGRPRDREKLRSDVLEMRARIAAGHQRGAGSHGDKNLFDVKHSLGGIIDVEFIVQYLILQHAHQHPALLDANDNTTALECARALGLIPSSLAAATAAAYSAYRLWMHRERLRGNETVRVARTEAQSHQVAVSDLWGHVFGAMRETGGFKHA
jgi:[glutamine synthetase] adenylyltransferase / [glutamine synthetase]-adenylyl-L-tyrosine phosphorylase